MSGGIFLGMHSQPTVDVNFRELNKSQFTFAKRLWGGATYCKFVLLGMGLTAAISTVPSNWPFIMLGIAFLSESLQLWSDFVKGRAESLLRKLDFCGSFGHELSDAEKRDIASTISSRARRKFRTFEAEDTYFDSTNAPSALRAVENLYESAWYSARLAAGMCMIYAIGILSVIVFSFVLLTHAIQSDPDPEKLIKIVSAWLMVMVSLNMIKMVWAYFRMHQRCQITESAAQRLRKSDPSEADAAHHWREYQLARNSFPLIPDWFWGFREKSLNEAWNAGGKQP
jgi:hypothetical protein